MCLCVVWSGKEVQDFLSVGLETHALCDAQLRKDLHRMTVVVNGQRVTDVDALMRSLGSRSLSLSMGRLFTQSLFAIPLFVIHNNVMRGKHIVCKSSKASIQVNGSDSRALRAQIRVEAVCPDTMVTLRVFRFRLRFLSGFLLMDICEAK